MEEENEKFKAEVARLKGENEELSEANEELSTTVEQQKVEMGEQRKSHEKSDLLLATTMSKLRIASTKGLNAKEASNTLSLPQHAVFFFYLFVLFFPLIFI